MKFTTVCKYKLAIIQLASDAWLRFFKPFYGILVFFFGTLRD